MDYLLNNRTVNLSHTEALQRKELYNPFSVNFAQGASDHHGLTIHAV